MGRPPTIDRDKVLDLAEAILLTDGTGALTIDAVAKAAGTSKGGIQSRFGTKDALIGAMIERWSAEYDSRMALLLGPDPAPVATVAGHVEVTMGMAAADYARAAGFMATLIEATQRRAESRRWYAERFGGLDPHSKAGQRARLALLATEGAFLLRAFGLMEIAEEDWQGIHADLRTLLDGKL